MNNVQIDYWVRCEAHDKTWSAMLSFISWIIRIKFAYPTNLGTAIYSTLFRERT